MSAIGCHERTCVEISIGRQAFNMSINAGPATIVEMGSRAIRGEQSNRTHHTPLDPERPFRLPGVEGGDEPWFVCGAPSI
jgi:hypothetical protein